MNNFLIKPIPSRLLLYLHFFICSIGLLAILLKLGIYFGRLSTDHLNYIINYQNWALSNIYFKKPSELLSYLIPSIGIVVYYSFAYLYINFLNFKNKQNLLNSITQPSKTISYILILSSIVIIQASSGRNLSSIFLNLFFWLIIFIYPLIKGNILIPNNKIITGIGLCFLISLICIFWFFFLKIPTLPLTNDYINIPEKTLLHGNYVSNLEYINQHKIGGVRYFDLWGKDQSLQAFEDYLPIENNNSLQQYISANKQHYFYNPDVKGLIIYGTFSDKDKNLLCGAAKNKKDCDAINKFFEINNSHSFHYYTSEEKNFIKKNLYEISNQAAPGHYFHHHHAFLGPINEYLLGKPSSQTMFIYGWLNTIVLAKLITWTGGITFEKYLQFTNFFYPLYYTLVALAAFILFRNIWITLLVTIASLASCYLIGFESIHMAPGFNPLRHFLDIPILISFYYYLFGKNKNLIFLILTCGLSLLSYFANKEFGLFILISIGFAVFVNFIDHYKTKFFDLLCIIITFLLIISLSFLIKTSGNPDALYYLAGIFTVKISFSIIRDIIWGLSLIYMIILFSPWEDQRWKYISLFLLAYGQTLLLYYIWNPAPNHLYSILIPWVFLSVILAIKLFNINFLKTYAHTVLIIITIVVFFGAFFPAFITYIHDSKNYKKYIDNHFLYSWNFSKAHFKSTMDPIPFENAVNLIQKYSKNNGIYIISKYDNIIPFLANKYTLMPFLQTDLSLVTSKEIQMAANSILSNQPNIIFVDSDIDYPQELIIFQKNDPLLKDFNVSWSNHVMVLNGLKEVFMLVKNQYIPIEKVELITVYKHV